jgi:hypothetical protein
LKALKIWDGFLLAVAVGLYLTGIFTGEFSRFNGLLFWGHSLTAVFLIVGSVLFLILFVSILLVIKAVEKR